ncbi:hypothetical protein EDI28_02265 [Photobacterium chitinilyticum]|uniref:Uncharacterized protein n=2 Tax=Photobacterium chitinilyticum TaxID=2485123 RepID=A0A3S3ULM6_9GAMM|nr:hypothetical protein EDI28_02265 [Photobacterium chitinilyticum]
MPSEAVMRYAGGYVFFEYLGEEDYNIKIKVTENSRGNYNYYHYSLDPSLGIQTPTRIVGGGEYSLKFKKTGGKKSNQTKIIMFIASASKPQPQPQRHNLVFDIKGERFNMIFDSGIRHNSYCALTVVDSVGGIAFNDKLTMDSASLLYQTITPSNVTFSYKRIRIKSYGVIKKRVKRSYLRKLNNKFSEIFYVNNRGSFVVNSSGLMKRQKNDKFEISGYGTISIIPFFNVKESELLSGRYKIEVTATCGR